MSSTIYVLAAIALGMLIGTAGASFIIARKDFRNSVILIILVFFTLIVTACTCGTFFLHHIYRYDWGVLSLIPLFLIELYAVISGLILRLFPLILKGIQTGEQIHWPTLITAICFILLPLCLWACAPRLLDRFTGLAFAILYSFILTAIIYFLSNTCFWLLRKLA